MEGVHTNRKSVQHKNGLHNHLDASMEAGNCTMKELYVSRNYCQTRST